LSFLGFVVVCVSLQHTPVIAGKDAPASTSKSKRRPEKPKKAKKTEENADNSQKDGPSSPNDSSSGLPASAVGAIPGPSASGGAPARSNGKGASAGAGTSAEKQPVGKTAAPSDEGPNPELVKKVMDIQNRAHPESSEPGRASMKTTMS
jgi:hypothetical protein